MAITVFGLKSGLRLQRKDTYFQHSTSEQFTGKYWVDGKKIYTKTVKYDGNDATNINVNVNLGISASTVSEIWIDYHSSFAYFATDNCSGPLFTVSKSGWYGVYAYLINLNTTGNIQINIQCNSNTNLNRCYITVYYTKTTG